MNFPDNLRYTKDHEWIMLLEDGATALVGITDFAQSELGDIVFVETKPVGTKVGAHEVFGTVEAVKTVADLYAPVAGEIVAVNEALDAAEIVNSSPYADGWIVKLKLDSPDAIGSLLSPADYRALIGE
ncbi:MAG: glycine cleavage system protein GcvH [Chlorobiaceae bacterium]|nr:glycine cleavage system protein GcvH [Chlorobiales bacterium]NTU91226.1 glycine cleavage system protein GcvH [Chlorobiaceae bacterium]NTV25030.1 glycine cleavage system protein GcvH [Chlorobiaceae bacterium]